MLLGSNDHSRSHEAHKGDNLIRGESVAVDEVGSNQAARPSKTSFAVYCDTFSANSNHLMSQVDKLANQSQRRARAVIEDHVEMLDAQGMKVGGRVEFRIQADNKSDVALGKV